MLFIGHDREEGERRRMGRGSERRGEGWGEGERERKSSRAWVRV